MFSKDSLNSTSKSGHEILTPVQTKVTSSIGSSWNFSEELAPVTEELRKKLWSWFSSEEDLTESMNRLSLITRHFKSSSARTNTGHCSMAMHTRLLTCHCCKFFDPLAIIEVRVFGMIARYYDNSRYDGIAVRMLVPESALGDRSYSPDMMLYQEMQNDTFLWSDHVSRYFSRFHWEAVRHETKRLCKIWLDFMHLVNSNQRVMMFANNKLTKRYLEALSPEIPPQPPRGDFLLSKNHSVPMRKAVQERIDLFWTTACYLPYNAKTETRYQLCDVADRMTIYSNEEGVPFSGNPESLVTQLLLVPERKRRCINSIREGYPQLLGEYFCPTDISLTESVNSVNGNSLYDWSCTEQIAKLCIYALGGSDVPLWCTYIPGITNIHQVKHFWCSEYEDVLSLLEALFIRLTCDGVCRIEVRLFNNFEELNQLGYFECRYSIGVPVNPDLLGDALGPIENFIRKECVADNVQLEYLFEFEECLKPCVLVYKFEYQERFEL